MADRIALRKVIERKQMGPDFMEQHWRVVYTHCRCLIIIVDVLYPLIGKNGIHSVQRDEVPGIPSFLLINGWGESGQKAIILIEVQFVDKHAIWSD